MSHRRNRHTEEEKRQKREKFDKVLSLYKGTAKRRVKKSRRDKVVEKVNLIMLGKTCVKPLSEWKPTGKSKDRLSVSLLRHYTKYPVPEFLYQEALENRFGEVFFTAAYGGSFHKSLKAHTDFRPTKKISAFVWRNTPKSLTLVQAYRRAQTLCFGGSERLAKEIYSLHAEFPEEFVEEMIHWFARQGMLDVAQVSPLADFLYHKLEEDDEYSLKGRTALSVMKAMVEWHNDLGIMRSNYEGTKFVEPSEELSSWNGSRKVKGSKKEKIEETWRIRQILSLKALMQEGRELRHCAASYWSSMTGGRVTMWSMTKSSDLEYEKRKGTIEVVGGKVVQARGFGNSRFTGYERSVLKGWALKNGLGLSIYT